MIGALLGIVLILHNHDVATRDLGTFGLYLALAVALPGVFCWRLLLGHLHAEEDRRPTWFEDLSLGTIFGFGIQLPVYLVGVWVDVPHLFLITPVVVLVLSLAAPFGRRVWTMPTAKVDARVSWALAAVVLYAVTWLARYVFTHRPLTLAPYKTPSVDETFHQALISELLHRFPPEIPFLLGTRLDYHWFVHAQMAADHWATGLETSLMLRDLMPVAMVALTVLGLGAAALRLSGRPVAAVIAPALIVAGGFSLMGPHYDAGTFTEAFLSRRYVSSPSQAYGFMMALPPIVLILEVLRPDRKASRLTWLALVLALLALAGSKATFMPIFLCGAVVLFLAQLVFRRTFDRTAAALTVLLLAVTIFAQVVLFGSTSGGMRVDFFLTANAALKSQHIAQSTTAQVVMTVTLLIGWLLYGTGVAGLVKGTLWRDPRAVWMTFTVLAGVSVAFVFFRSGLSQLWFQRSVAPVVVLLSAWGLAVLLPNPVPRRLGAILAGLAAAAGLGAYLIGRYAEEGNAVVQQATYHEILATAVTPLVLVAIYLAVRLVIAMAHRPNPGPLVLVAVLLGLSLTHVYSLGYDTVTQRAEPHGTPPNQFAPGGVQAATWIADNSGRYDIVATNVHCRKPVAPKCDNRNFWVSAYTERRIVIEGWGYTQATNGDYSDEGRNAYIPAPDPERLRINDAAFTHPTAETVDRLVNTYDVEFLFVSKHYPADLPGLNALKDLLTRTYVNKNYVVFQVR
ncbi:MAG: hypothetical protein M3O94_09655 [Actinomycetota bacterium]|nr:hypothetical protein [Actinomycetota bacterium]